MFKFSDIPQLPTFFFLFLFSLSRKSDFSHTNMMGPQLILEKKNFLGLKFLKKTHNFENKVITFCRTTRN